MPNICPDCVGGTLMKLLVLPGGKEVWQQDTPLSEDIRGVDAVEECRDCGARYDPDSPETTHFRDQ